MTSDMGMLTRMQPNPIGTSSRGSQSFLMPSHNSTPPTPSMIRLCQLTKSILKPMTSPPNPAMIASIMALALLPFVFLVREELAQGRHHQAQKPQGDQRATHAGHQHRDAECEIVHFHKKTSFLYELMNPK